MIRLFLILMSVLLSLSVYSQNDDIDYNISSEKFFDRLTFHDLFYSSGVSYRTVPSEGISDFQKLAPQSALLKNDITGFSAVMDDTFGSQAQVSFGLTLSLDPKQGNVRRGQSRFRLALHTSNGTLLGARYATETTTTIDTLTGTNPSLYVIIDSVYSRNYTMSYDTRSIGLDLAFIRTTNPEKRWSVWSGAGIMIGAIIQPNARIRYDETAYTESQAQAASQINYRKTYYGETTNEQFRTKSSWMTTVYVPFGLDFRIGKKRVFWMPFHLYYEFRPMLHFQGVPELGTIIAVNQSIHGGIRYAF